MTYAQMLAETIIWLAQEKMKTEPFQNINAAIVSVSGDIYLELSKFMKEQKNG